MFSDIAVFALIRVYLIFWVTRERHLWVYYVDQLECLQL